MVHLRLNGKRIHKPWLPISDNWTFSLALTAEALISEICEIGIFCRGGSLWAQILAIWGRRPQSIYGPDTSHFTTLLLEVLTQRNYLADFFRQKLNFYCQIQQTRVLCHFLVELGVTYTVHLWLRSDQIWFIVDFLCSTNMPNLKCTCNEDMKGNAKCKKFSFEPPFGGTYGSAQGSPMARWKAHCRLTISDNSTFSLALTAVALLSEICQNRRFLKGWVILGANCR